MVLNNVWWQLIWLFLFGAINLLFFQKREELVEGRSEAHWGRLPAIVLALPYIIWAAWRTNAYGDTGAYRNSFFNAPTTISGIWPYVMSKSKDKGYALIEAVFKTIISHSDIFFFFVIAAIQLFCLVYVYRRFSKNYWFSMFLFVSSADYIGWMHNGTRQFLAVAIVFACLPLIVKKRYVVSILIVLLASQIHLSALIFLPFIFIINGRAWNFRTLLFLLAIILSIIFLDEVTGILSDAVEDTVYSAEVEQIASGRGTNIFRVLFHSVPAAMSLIFRPYIDKADNRLMNACANLSIAAAGIYVFSFFTSGLLVGRVPIYFSLANYILLPWLIEEVFSPTSALVVEMGIMGVYIVFFQQQMAVWQLL